MNMKLPGLDISNESDWRADFAQGIRSAEDLLKHVNLTPEDVDLAEGANLGAFPLRVPQSYVAKIEKGNPRDPLLLQVLPLKQEFQPQPGYVKDPLHEEEYNTAPGVIHKYLNRALFVATQACAIHCRYCFRRHFPYSDNAMTADKLKAALDYIASRQELDEVILSGGDPLSLSDAKLFQVLDGLNSIQHLKRIRIHTRLLAIMPNRVTDAFLVGLKALQKHIVIVVHINHPNEIDDQFIQAAGLLRKAGVHLLNQTVLLAGINDNVQTLNQLSHRLMDAGVLPYYLHLLDPVEGASHFNISDAQAIQFVRELLEQLPGYLVPKLVREVAGFKNKLPVDLGLYTQK